MTTRKGPYSAEKYRRTNGLRAVSNLVQELGNPECAVDSGAVMMSFLFLGEQLDGIDQALLRCAARFDLKEKQPGLAELATAIADYPPSKARMLVAYERLGVTLRALPEIPGDSA